MTRLRTNSRTTWVCLCGVAALATAALGACGGPKPIEGSRSITGSGGSGSGPGINLTPGASSTKTSTTTTPGGPPTEADGGNCGVKSSSVTPQPPDLLLVLDKTGSLTRAMDSASECAAGSTTCQQRWATLVSGLNAVLTSSSADVNWGLELFNSDGSCGVAAPEVPIAPGSAAAVQAYIATVTPGGSTPTRLAIDTAVTYLKTLTDTNAKYILLATDGEPNCLNTGGGRGGGGGAGASDVQGTVTSIGLAYTAGFPTFVIGVGIETGNLDNFATAGGTTNYYPATSPDQLTAALNAIVGTVASCTFALGSAPPDPNNIVIEFNGDHNLRPPRDTTHTNGWDYTSPAHNAIQVYGPWCDNVTNGSYTTTKVIMGCPGQPIP
jgi:hypothetical protein